jgi:tetratricopeptide (TPR) repeat protein
VDDQKNSFNQIRLADDRVQTAVVVELCRKHLRKFPKHGIAWLYYGMAQIDLHRYAAAEKAIRRALSLCPQNSLAIANMRMGHLFNVRGEYIEAARWYRKAVKLKPHDATYHIFLADNAFKFGFLKEAEKHFRTALKCSEGAVDEAYFNLGGILLGRRDYHGAIECYKEALKIDPKYKIAKERLNDAELALFLANS